MSGGIGVSTFSMTLHGRNEPFELQVARGQIPYHSTVNIIGYSTNVGSTAAGPLWEGLTPSGGLYVYPSGNVIMQVVSTNNVDYGLNVAITGLDTNFLPVSETVTLTGNVTINTVNSYYRINDATVTNGLNLGNVTISNASTTYAQITSNIGQTQMSIYTVPAGNSFALYSVQAYANIGFTSSAYVTYSEYNKFNLSGGNTNILTQSPFVQIYNSLQTSQPIVHPGGTDIQFLFKASTGTNTTVGLQANGTLIKNYVTSQGY